GSSKRSQPTIEQVPAAFCDVEVVEVAEPARALVRENARDRSVRGRRPIGRRWTRRVTGFATSIFSKITHHEACRDNLQASLQSESNLLISKRGMAVAFCRP